MRDGAGSALARHDLVTVDAAEWVGRETEPLLQEWSRLGRPLITRRRSAAEPPDRVPLGLPLPPALGKRRLAVSVPPSAILAIKPPPLLADLISFAPPPWRPTIDRLLALDDETRCFGSLAWQALTGLVYLSPGSDLDLLWRPASRGLAERLLGGLTAISADSPITIDGEVIDRRDAAAQWRELASGAGEILTKRIESVDLVGRDDFLDGFDAP